MNLKKWLVASLVAFIVFSVMEWILHGSILASAYQANAKYFLPQATISERMWAIYLGYLIYAGMFTLIYSKGYEAKPGLGEGLRFGLYIGFFTAIPRFIIDFAVSPIPAAIAVPWLIAGIVESIILGLVVGALYKKVPSQPVAA